ncbi:hypothetical protein [Candidatus Poriferisodalis sp.]|uniref:hypothetical protein n=1 Tax=Candidatus Poriferisodalis sp. TaxID=3101277 RepID=UPI003B014C6B
MSPDNTDENALEDDALGDALLHKDLEPLKEDLEAEELAAGDLDENPDDDDSDDLDVDDSAEDDEPSSREVPTGVRLTDDDDDEDEDEEFEADLGEILKERLASEDDDDDEDDAVGIVTGSRAGTKQEEEILCEGCFLLIKPSQFDTRSPEPSCPHCGTPISC